MAATRPARLAAGPQWPPGRPWASHLSRYRPAATRRGLRRPCDSREVAVLVRGRRRPLDATELHIVLKASDPRGRRRAGAGIEQQPTRTSFNFVDALVEQKLKGC